MLDAAVAEAQVDVPEKLVHARAHELLEQTMSSLARRGISKDAYLRIAGQDEETLAHEAEPEAEKALRREAVLAAVVETEKIEPSEDDIRQALEPSAERAGTKVEKVLEDLRSNGRLDRVREDIATGQALELLVREAKPITRRSGQSAAKVVDPRQGRRGGAAWALVDPGS